VDPSLLRGLAAAESGGDPRARSRAGAVGLLQVLPSTAAEQARRLGLDPARVDLEDPATNLRLGAAYLGWLLAQFGGDERFALAAYNAGPENVRRWRLRAPDADSEGVVRREGFPETRAHGARVLRFREAYRR
jgi:soluble lytic murein transglycosylase